MDMKEYIERQEVYSEINELPLTEDAAMEILWTIDHIPTADVAPVVHGHWIETANTWTHDYDEASKRVYRCSKCGRIEKIQEPFCNCGAKMDRVR